MSRKQGSITASLKRRQGQPPRFAYIPHPGDKTLHDQAVNSGHLAAIVDKTDDHFHAGHCCEPRSSSMRLSLMRCFRGLYGTTPKMALRVRPVSSSLNALPQTFQNLAGVTFLGGQHPSLQQKVAAAAANIRSWAYARLKLADPNLVARVESHREEERQQLLETQQKERETKQEERRGQKGTGLGR